MRKSITILKSQLAKKGGAEKYARLLGNALANRGHEVRILTTGPSASDTPYEVVTTPIKSKTSFSKIWEFESFTESFLKANPSDIILGLDRNRFQTHLRASSGVHKAFLDHRTRYEPRWKRLRHLFNPLHTTLLHIEKTGFEHPDLEVLFTNSHLVKNEILSHYEIDSKKIEVIHNGVEWVNWQESFDNWEAFHNKERFEFLFIGGDFNRKGLKRLLHAFVKIGKKDVRLSIVGHDKNEKEYKHLAKKLGIQEKVTFFGAQADVLPFLQKADCLVIPTHYDPFANVTVEALAMGLFVISSKTNGGSEVLTHQTGIVAHDLFEGLEYALTSALSRPKTHQSAILIRNCVRHLDVTSQLAAYLDKMKC